MALTGGSLFSTNVLIIASCSFDSNHPYNPQVSLSTDKPGNLTKGRELPLPAL
ncbi:hypothetical protein GR995_001574 [Salmonella enterica]|nr:hypothetical protein [Salmonella enterica]